MAPLPIGDTPRNTFSVHGADLEIGQRSTSDAISRIASGRLGELPVRIDYEFACDASVEVFVAFRCLLEVDHLYIDDLGDGQSVPNYRLHKLPVGFQHCR